MEGYRFEDLKVGMRASVAKTITEADILLYAAVSTDTNPVHINAEAAENSLFKGRVAHGMLSAGLISAALGTKLPGPGTIYLSQSLRFRAPVRPGETVRADVEVAALDPAKHRATLRTSCFVKDKLVIDGEALVQVPTQA